MKSIKWQCKKCKSVKAYSKEVEKRVRKEHLLYKAEDELREYKRFIESKEETKQEDQKDPFETVYNAIRGGLTAPNLYLIRIEKYIETRLTNSIKKNECLAIS